VQLRLLGAKAFPEAFAAFESLGDAYEANGQKKAAKDSFEKAILLMKKDNTINETDRNTFEKRIADKIKMNVNQ
jgi:hypothetical protein